MYLDFYGFKEKPFELTPDPRFLYLGANHKEALGLLTYGVLERKGFVLLTGEVGTGKTTMAHALLKHLDGATRTVYLSNPALRPEDFLYYIASSLELKTTTGGKGEFLIKFEKFLRECLATRTNIVLIIDEAQDLSFELLEEIRLLSNMETGDEKLLNIILVGQPELNTLLRASQCRPLLQRISIRYHLTPLNLAETKAYIQQRILASGGPPDLFHKSVIAEIHRHSRGYPRLINSICDNTLLLGYVKEKKKLTTEMVRESYTDMELPLPVVAASTPDDSGKKPDKQKPYRKKRSLKETLAKRDIFSSLKVAFLILLAVLALFTLFSHKPLLTYWQGLTNGPDIAAMSAQPESVIPLRQPILEESGPPLLKEPGPTLSGDDTAESPEASNAPIETVAKRDIVSSYNEPHHGEMAVLQRSQTIRVSDGDILLGLSLRVYGIANYKIFQLLKSSNPGIDDPDLIKIGQEIVFPGLTRKEIPGRYSVHVASFADVYECGSAYSRFKKISTKVHALLSSDNENSTFRIALGTLATVQEAREYADDLLAKGLVDFAKPVALPMVGPRQGVAQS